MNNKNILSLLGLCIYILCNSFAISAQSVLNSGTWYKIPVTQSGIYKIDYDYLSKLGVDINNINPQNIHIYGNGGAMLSQANDEFRHIDLVENSIKVSGESDGKFDQTDAIYFYAEGPNTLSYNSSSNKYEHTINLYSDKNYYFLNIDDNSGKRITLIQSSGTPDTTYNVTQSYSYHELEDYNLLQSGRSWYGESFGYYTERDFGINLNDVKSSSDVTIDVTVMSTSTSSSYFSVYLNNNNLGDIGFSTFATTAPYGRKGSSTTKSFTVSSDDYNLSNSTLKLTFEDNGNSDAKAYLDKYQINYSRTNNYNGSQLFVRNSDALNHATCKYEISNANSNCWVWNVSNATSSSEYDPELVNSTLSFTSDDNDSLSQFIVFEPNNTYTPQDGFVIENQNLHGINKAYNMIIVTTSNFVQYAQQLADFRLENDSISSYIVNVDEIYNEYSSGKQDITAIRDFIRDMYFKSSSSDSLQYILLFGDGSYDYKNISDNNLSFVPIYESRESLHNINSFSSDDFYAFMDSDEGTWQENPSGDHKMDLGVGRLPVNTETEAQQVVNKIIHYSTNQNAFDGWRNRITFVADDGDGVLHMNHAETHANELKTLFPELNTEKIYLDSYVQKPAPGGEESPQTNTAIDNAIEKGSLIMNYTGHGGQSGWAQEKILNANQISNWDNEDKLPLFVTATCEFGRYDLPNQTSPAEQLLLKSDGGAIALVTTTRAVYAHSNLDMNKAVYDFAFERFNNGDFYRLGDIIKHSKNEEEALYNINNRNFSLLGDPSLRLSYARNKAIVSSINGKTVQVNENDTIRALEEVSIEGYITSPQGDSLKTFNGEIEITVFDKESNLETLGNEGSLLAYSAATNFIYKGTGTVTNGQFSISFIAPKDIGYQYDYGKISIYAHQFENGTDATGYYNKIVIGGTNPNYVEDNTGPTVSLYMDDETFDEDGYTSQNPTLVVKLEDDNGINVSNAGIGHEIIAILDEDEDNPIVLNDFFVGTKDNYKLGYVNYPLFNLSEGEHTIRVKAWDTHNNSGENSIRFNVIIDDKLELRNIYNFPNPFSEQTNISVEHNRAEDDLRVTVQIYSIEGRLVRTLEQEFQNAYTTLEEITWNGETDGGEKARSGMYIYKVEIQSIKDNSTSTMTGRLMLAN